MNSQQNTLNGAAGNSALILFTDKTVLEQIDPRRFQKLFDHFRNDLASHKTILPDAQTANGTYFEELSIALASQTIPDRLRKTLLALEAATLPENQPQVEAAILRRIPNISVSQTSALDRSLELWFHAPEEFATFCLASTLDPRHSGQFQHVSVSPFPPDSNTPPFQPSVSPASPLPAPSSAPVSPFPQDSGTPPLQSSASLLSDLASVLSRFVILPQYAAGTLALWIVHTYAFHLRDVTTYIGIESPEMRCGKTTLLSILNELCNRPLASSNISPPAFFRVIEDMSPTLLIDEVDTFLHGNDQFRGILNAGYSKKTAFVLRAAPATAVENSPRPSDGRGTEGEGSSPIARFSCWCPKALAKIGRFPDTLADRCIIIKMQRKTPNEQCESLRNFDPTPLKEQCARFVAQHEAAIASARPAIPAELNDRAADIWEPLLVLADIAGGDWPANARKFAIGLTAGTQELSPITSLLLDLLVIFSTREQTRIPTSSLIELLLSCGSRPWNENLKTKDINHIWLAKQLRPYGCNSRNIRVGDRVVKGYDFEDLFELFRRYLPRSVVQAYLDEHSSPAKTE